MSICAGVRAISVPISVELSSAMLESAGEGQGSVAPKAKCPLVARHTSPN